MPLSMGTFHETYQNNLSNLFRMLKKQCLLKKQNEAKRISQTFPENFLKFCCAESYIEISLLTLV